MFFSCPHQTPDRILGTWYTQGLAVSSLYFSEEREEYKVREMWLKVRKTKQGYDQKVRGDGQGGPP